MAWRWDGTNWVWQVVNAPGQLLDAHYAYQWYKPHAQYAATAIASVGATNAARQAAVSNAIANAIVYGSAQYASTNQAATTTLSHYLTKSISDPLQQVDITLQAGANLLQGGAPLALGGFSYTRMGTPTGVSLGYSINAVNTILKPISAGLSFVPAFTEHAIGSDGFFKAYGKAGLGVTFGIIGSHIGTVTGLAAGPLGWVAAPALGLLFGAAGVALGDAADYASTQFGRWLSSHDQQPQSSPPSVGGVLLDKVATVSTPGSISGAYWDSDTGSVVLIIEDASGSTSASAVLPGLERDLLVVALRAALAGESLGVSIDPPARFRNGGGDGEVPADGTPMIVSYLGSSNATLAGSIMFEADRLMKCLSKGRHNESRRPLRAHVPGYEPLVEMIRPGRESSGAWHRFWFVPDKVELWHDRGHKAIAFADVRLKVLTELEMRGEPTMGNGKCTDELDEAFAGHLTEHYDEYAKEFPEFVRLKELVKIAAIAKYLVIQDLASDLWGLYSLLPRPVATPATTPVIHVTSPHVKVEQHGQATVTQSIALVGGVDVDPKLSLQPDDRHIARSLVTRAQAARPTRGATSWKVAIEGRNGLQAAGVPIGQFRPFRYVCVDHEFNNNAASPSFALRREYESTRETAGAFGVGWRIRLPFRIVVVPPNAKHPDVLTAKELRARHTLRPMLVLQDYQSHTSARYRAISNLSSTAGATFCRVRTQQSRNGDISFTYDPADRIQEQGDSYVIVRGDTEYMFNKSGRMVALRRGGRTLVTFRWAGARLSWMSDPRSRSFELIYGGPDEDHVKEVRVSDGATIRYQYDALGRLVARKGGNHPPERYGYDDQDRLTEVQDSAGGVLASAVYGAQGVVDAVGEDELQTLSGEVLRRTISKSRVRAVGDHRGATADFAYGSQGALQSVSVQNRGDLVLRLDYDPHGRVREITNVRGQTERFEYGTDGRLQSVTSSTGRTESLQWDREGRIVAVSDEDAGSWTADYDETGKLRQVRGTSNETWRFDYAGPMLVNATGPMGRIVVSPRRQSLTVKHELPDGAWHKLVYDKEMRPVRSQRSGASAVSVSYDPHGYRLDTIAGAFRYRYDETELTWDVSFEA